jgi:hypothetical protein
VSRTVHKYALDHGRTTITGGSPQVVHVGVDPAGSDALPTVWVELDPEGEDAITLSFIGTGHVVPRLHRHIGSVVMPVRLVWHVYQDTIGTEDLR